MPIRRTLMQALEVARLNVQWHQENYPFFEQYMSTTLKPKVDEDQKDLLEISRQMREELMKRDEED